MTSPNTSSSLNPTSSYTFSEIHNFPPFYTLQPNLDTRQKQIQLWTDMVLDYCRAMRICVLDLAELQARGDLFRNEKIRRYLNLEFIRAITDDLASKERLEFLDPQRMRCLVWWRRPDEWASLLYELAVARGLNGSIVTVYEVQHGGDFSDSDFANIDSLVLNRILSILEKQGKATVFQGNDSSDAGIKFA